MWAFCKEVGKLVLFVAAVLLMYSAWTALGEWERLAADLRVGVRQMVGTVEGER